MEATLNMRRQRTMSSTPVYHGVDMATEPPTQMAGRQPRRRVINQRVPQPTVADAALEAGVLDPA